MQDTGPLLKMCGLEARWVYQSALAKVMLHNKLPPPQTQRVTTPNSSMLRIYCGLVALEQALFLAAGWTGLAPGCRLGSHLPRVRVCLSLSLKEPRPPRACSSQGRSQSARAKANYTCTF